MGEAFFEGNSLNVAVIFRMGQRFVDIEKLDIRPVFVVVIDGLDAGVGTVENRTSETTGYKDRVFSICDIGQRPFSPLVVKIGRSAGIRSPCLTSFRDRGADPCRD